jgi:acyl-CoA thioesterase FadM
VTGSAPSDFPVSGGQTLGFAGWPHLINTHRIVDIDCDANGHMSVRRYAELAESAALTVGADIGHDRGAIVSIREVVTRQHREQFLGTELFVLCGVVSIAEYVITMHIETRSRDELASTHLLSVGNVDPDQRTPLRLPPHSFEMLQRFTDEGRVVDQPDYGRPRRPTTAPMRQPTLDEVTAHDVELWSDRLVEPVECDHLGWFAGGPAQLAWGRADMPRPTTRWQFPDADGHPYALTNVEHRRVVFSTPRVGAHLKTLAANMAIEQNRRVRREWTFDVDSGTLHAMGEFVDLVIDLEARRATKTPDHVRLALTDHLHPDLGDLSHDLKEP